MDVHAFRLAFEGSTRALLDFDALTSSSRDVTIEVLDEAGLGGLLTAWYVALDGTLGDYSDPDSSPMSVAEVLSNPAAWPAERAEAINEMRRGFVEGPGSIVLLVPAVRVRGRLLVLDGTHRASAALLSGRGARVVVVALAEHADPAVPDVTRWLERLDQSGGYSPQHPGSAPHLPA